MTHVLDKNGFIKANDYSSLHSGVAAEISAMTEKGTPVGGDVLAIEDSAASWAKKKIYINKLPIVKVGGRLTVTSGQPHNNASAVTTLYYTPYFSDLFTFDDQTTLRFAETSVAVPATTNTPFDIFAYNNSGTFALETLNWTNDSTRATAVVRDGGRLVKSGDTTRVLVGTARTTGVSGQTEDSLTRRLVSNFFNREMRTFYKIETTGHSYTTTTWRAWNNDTTHRVDFMACDTHFVWGSFVGGSKSDGTNLSNIGLCLDATNTYTAQFGYFANYNANYISAGNSGATAVATGYHYLQGTERGATGAYFLHEYILGAVWQ